MLCISITTVQEMYQEGFKFLHRGGNWIIGEGGRGGGARLETGREMYAIGWTGIGRSGRSVGVRGVLLVTAGQKA